MFDIAHERRVDAIKTFNELIDSYNRAHQVTPLTTLSENNLTLDLITSTQQQLLVWLGTKIGQHEERVTALNAAHATLALVLKTFQQEQTLKCQAISVSMCTAEWDEKSMRRVITWCQQQNTLQVFDDVQAFITEYGRGFVNLSEKAKRVTLNFFLFNKSTLDSFLLLQWMQAEQDAATHHLSLKIICGLVSPLFTGGLIILTHTYQTILASKMLCVFLAGVSLWTPIFLIPLAAVVLITLLAVLLEIYVLTPRVGITQTIAIINRPAMCCRLLLSNMGAVLFLALWLNPAAPLVLLSLIGLALAGALVGYAVGLALTLYFAPIPKIGAEDNREKSKSDIGSLSANSWNDVDGPSRGDLFSCDA